MTTFTVLLVDDSPFILKALVRSLKDEGYALLTAASAHEALTILSERPVDAIVSDQNMPGLTGTDFFRAVRERNPETVRIMLTGAASAEVAKEAISQGQVYRFFTKPWDDCELAFTLKCSLREKAIAAENALLRSIVEKQRELLERLEREHPGITELGQTAGGSFSGNR